jgi:hypothetical protein
VRPHFDEDDKQDFAREKHGISAAVRLGAGVRGQRVWVKDEKREEERESNEDANCTRDTG